MSIYFTKCGREFNKSSTATVTGYRMADDDVRCHGDGAGQAPCPFRVEVTEDWPPVHKCWECRAGSQPPNHTTEWTGSLTDKNSIQIHSLDVALMEEIMAYCEAHPALGAAYNTDHLEDCRRTIAVHCISNKTGIAAKQELIAKFFPEKAKGDDICEESTTNSGSGSCALGIQEDIATSTVDRPTATTARDSSDTIRRICQECGLFGERLQSEACGNSHRCHRIYPGGKTGITLPSNTACEHFIEKGEVEVISENQLCIRAQEDCAYFCKHNKGCSLLLVGKRALPELLNQSSDIDCDVFRKVKNDQNKGKNNDFLPENVTKTDEIVTFDYSTVDEETAEFLIEKQNNILRIKTMSMLAIAKELKEAQDKLSNHNQGTFISWCESIGYPKSTTYDYLRTYDWVVRNSDNGIDFEGMQKSLLFAVSKPSARPELQQAVLAGDIKTHKEYKELEEKFHEAEARANEAVRLKYQADSAKIKAESEFKKLASESANHIKANLKTIHELNQQLDQAKRNSDPAKVQELGQIISDKQREIDDLRQQLKDKPIEATASRVVEKLPDDVQEYLSSVNDTMRHMQNFAKVNQVLNLIVGLSTDELQSWAMMMNNRKAVDDDEESENLELLDTAIQSLQDMMEDYRNGGCE